MVLVAGYVLLRHRSRAVHSEEWQVRHGAAFAVGVGCLWLALDWPLGVLGSGYLLSAHTAQYLLITFVASPLLLLGLPANTWRRIAARGTGGRLLRAVARGLPAFAIYHVVLIVTHLPAVIDTAMRIQLGSFAADSAWLFGGLALWWPVLAPSEIALSPPLQIGYLFASTILPTAPAAFLTFADYPVYSLYELAPRVEAITALADQQIAGLAMKLGADPIIWLVMGIVFFRWSAQADAVQRPGELSQPS